MNEAENTLTLPKEISSEVFFKEEARRIQEAFNSKSNELDLEYLRHQLKCITYLSQNGREINALAVYFDHQINDLDNLLAKNEEQQGNSAIVES